MTSRHKKQISRKLKILALTMLTCITAVVLFFFSYLMGLNEWKKFDPKKVVQMQQTVLIYDKDGTEIKGLYDRENRVNIKLSEIPKNVANAFLAIEDARFYSHHGFDVIRFFGALAEDIKTGSAKEGGSTISQQLVKRTYLTNEKTLSRKLQEAIMSYQLEEAYTKDQILEMYINNVYFGNGANGIEAAAKKYFGKSAANLTLSEGALLAGVIKAPGIYAPHINMAKAVQRRNLVLSQMVKYNFITQQEADTAKAEAVTLAPKENKNFQYGYYIDMVLQESQQILNMDTEDLLSGGYRIYTAMDTAEQANLENLYTQKKLFPGAASDGVKPQSALIVLNSNTGGVSGLIGGRDYTGRLCLNRAVNMKRQPGSAIKPVLVYAPAIEKLKITPATLIMDSPVNYSGYSPKNFNGKCNGWVTVRDALAESLNIPAVKMFHQLGVEAGKLYASNVGIQFTNTDNSLALALGGFTQGVSPMELGASFVPFSNGGYYMKPYFVEKITDSNGNVLYTHDQNKYHVLSADTAYLISNMLTSTVEYGTGKRLKTEGMEIAAKTGTSGTNSIKGNVDSWVVAYNPEYTICCWMGYDKTDAVHCLPKDITGGTYPAELVKHVFDNLYKNKTAPKFQMPKGIVQAKIDLKTLKDENKVVLASAFTPADKEKTEYFTEDTVPKETSAYWNTPQPPDDLAVRDTGNGYPTISFTPKEKYIVYKLIRIQSDSNVACQIGEFSGKKGTIQMVDYDIKPGFTYLYYVVPEHPDLMIGTQKFSGPPSAYVSFPPASTGTQGTQGGQPY